MTAFPGDTIAVALWRHGVRVLGFTRKRHRPLGAGTLVLQGALVTVDGLPNVHADHTPVVEGMDVRRQGAWPHARFDLLRTIRWLPQRWTRSGFERPYVLRSGTWRFEAWERLLMALAGGAPPPNAPVEAAPGSRWDGDVVVIGAGPAGIAAANAAVAAGDRVCLVSRSPAPAAFAGSLGACAPPIDARVHTLLGHVATGIYRNGTVVLAAPRAPDAAAAVLVCKRLILATGKESLGPSVRGHDLPGVFDARTALRWAATLGSTLGPCVVSGTGSEGAVAEALRRLGVVVVEAVPVDAVREILGRDGVTGVRFAGHRVECRSFVHAGPWTTHGALAFQALAGGTLRLDPTHGNAAVTVVGGALAPNEAPSVPELEALRDVPVCSCMDVMADDLLRLTADGQTHVEEIKRATACGMGPCQGFPCWTRMGAVLAAAIGAPVNDTPSYRPPARGLTVAQAAALDGLLELE